MEKWESELPELTHINFLRYEGSGNGNSPPVTKNYMFFVMLQTGHTVQ